MSDDPNFFDLTESLGLDRGDLERWYDATGRLPAETSLDVLVGAFRWSHTGRPPLRHLPCEAIAHLEQSGADWRARALRYDGALASIVLDPGTVVSSLDHSVAALLALREPTEDGAAGLLRRTFPEWRGLTRGEAVRARGEHDESSPYPLLDNLCDRTLDRALRALEMRSKDHFPSERLSEATFDRHLASLERLRQNGLLAVVRAALLFLDFSKGGSEVERSEWRALGVDLTVHNTASQQIVARRGRLQELRGFDVEGSRQLALALIGCHGTTGQFVRGEVTLLAMRPVAKELRVAIAALVDGGLSYDEATRLVFDALHIVNVCDTAAVREGLWNDSLASAFAAAEDQLEAILKADSIAEQVWTMELAGFDDETAWLIDRLVRLRRGRIDAGEPVAEVERAVMSIEADVRRVFIHAFRNTQIWYGEAATSWLRPASQLKMMAIGVRSANAPNQLHHVNFAAVMRHVDRSDRAADYRVRLLDAVLEELPFEEVWNGGDVGGPLVSIASQIGGDDAATIDLDFDDEATALMTLLAIYETKNSAAFHRTLKEMCDLYGLRKDEFDRVANEGLYLAHMNSARSDKERMLDWCVPGEIVEVGPGGGVILDLLEERFVDSRIVGLDISEMVCEALRTRKESEDRRWEIVEGDAFELPTHVGAGGASTIIFCSVLHEIFSYVGYPAGDDGERFRIESVRALIRAAWDALAVGGRIVIRDGVKPADGVRRIRFIDPYGPDFLELFAEQFQARDIQFEWVSEGVAEMSTPDAMEFLYCYTWGPASFPYEVREQYGVLTYDAYVSALQEWVSDLEGEARVVELPPGEDSYLQPGYIDGLAPKIELMDGDGRPVALPDSNCLIVLEKVR